MRIRIVAVGRLKSGPEKVLIDEYLKRLTRFASVEVVELKQNDGERMLRHAEGATIVALDAGGKVHDSGAFARAIEANASKRKGLTAFIIGGAEGLPAIVRDRAHMTWSLSAMTLPHRLARVVLVEQIYRAMTILRGVPYDK